MAAASAWIASLAVIAGTILALWHLRGAAGRPPGLAGIAHGLVGAAALALLLLALRGPIRGTAYGAGSFGTLAAWLLGAALLSGVVIWQRRRQNPAVLIAVHAGLAITGWVLLLAWSSLS